MTRRKKKPSPRDEAVRAILAREHPHLERVTRAFRGKRPGAGAHTVGVDMDALCRHANQWMKRHGHAHQHLVGAARREARRDDDLEIVRVKVSAHALRHAAHPSKVVVVSHAKGKVVGEQG